jgi:hypothetical protein
MRASSNTRTVAGSSIPEAGVALICNDISRRFDHAWGLLPRFYKRGLREILFFLYFPPFDLDVLGTCSKLLPIGNAFRIPYG